MSTLRQVKSKTSTNPQNYTQCVVLPGTKQPTLAHKQPPKRTALPRTSHPVRSLAIPKSNLFEGPSTMLTIHGKAIFSQDVTKNRIHATTRTGQTPQGLPFQRPNLGARSNQSLIPLGPTSTSSLSTRSNQSIIPPGPASTST